MGKFDELELELQEEIKTKGSKEKLGNNQTLYRSIQREGYVGDFATEWWTDEDYTKHEKYVNELKAKGTYGKPWICELILKDMPEYDMPYKISGKPLESYRMEFIDFSKN
jgi:hypothetical protein